MKVWLYYRLSRDEDEELNSLNNQRKIIYNFAVSNGHQVVGESFDDNVSGMHFNREGIDKIYEVVEAGKIEAIIVKDLSRLGRHRTQTALFIDYLRERNVRVLSATENIDTFNENDDLIIGFKGLVNDFYARDGSRRVRTGYRQKQKEGIVTIPPFGYFKDKNTKKVVVVEEAAETVRMIFSAYIGGSGMKAIARTLNEQRRKTPALMQMELLNKRLPNTQDGILKKYLWDATMVGRILKDESYIGTLICHKSERNKINKTFRFTDPEEQFRHENYLPMIVTRETWELAQTLMTERKAKNTRAGTNKGILRYGGLLRCQDCGRTFIGKRIKLKDGERVVYVCDTYHRYGKEHCSSHMVDEEALDQLIRHPLPCFPDQPAVAGDKASGGAFAEEQPIPLQLGQGALHGVGIDAELLRQLPLRGYPAAGGRFACDYSAFIFTDNLQIDRHVILEIQFQSNPSPRFFCINKIIQV